LVKRDTLLPFYMPCTLEYSISRNRKRGTLLIRYAIRVRMPFHDAYCCTRVSRIEPSTNRWCSVYLCCINFVLMSHAVDRV